MTIVNTRKPRRYEGTRIYLDTSLGIVDCKRLGFQKYCYDKRDVRPPELDPEQSLTAVAFVALSSVILCTLMRSELINKPPESRGLFRIPRVSQGF